MPSPLSSDSNDYVVTLAPLDERTATSMRSAYDGAHALQQHGCYGLALKEVGGYPELLSVLYRDKVVFCAIVLKQQFWGVVNAHVAFRAALPKAELEVTSAILRAIKKHFPPWRWRFFAVMPDVSSTRADHALLRSAGYRRVMTGASTIWVDLRADAESLRAQLQSKWRNQLKKAEGEPLTLSIGGKKTKHYNWLLEREAEQRTHVGYAAIPVGVVPAYAKAAAAFDSNQAGVLSVSAYYNGQPVAGALFMRHGNGATYHIGWSGGQGRSLNAQNRVLFEGMLALKAEGVTWLDLGGVETKTQAGITRFKMGLGHSVTRLPGLYIAG